MGEVRGWSKGNYWAIFLVMYLDRISVKEINKEVEESTEIYSKWNGYIRRYSGNGVRKNEDLYL